MSQDNSTRPVLTASIAFLSLALTFSSLLITETRAMASKPATTGAAARFDVRFMQDMSQHHSMGIEMSQICVRKATHSQLRTLCKQVVATQSREIKMMQSWLQDWYGIRFTPEMRPGDMRMLERMKAMSGAEFEIDFMQTLMEHHMAANNDAKSCTKSAGHAKLVSLCQDIIAVQSKEIKQLQTWLSQWYGISSITKSRLTALVPTSRWL